MSEQKKIDENDLKKALDVLGDLAKGHSSRGTATTAVESMKDAGAGAGGSGGTQVFHTPSNSNPGGWAGSSEKDVGDDGAHDAIDENGTDYKGGAMFKSILEKLSKGLPLTAEEFAVVKAMPPFLKKDDKKDDKKDAKDAGKMEKSADADADDKDDDKDVKKSLADEAQGNETVAQGMEISDFLAEFVGTVSKSLSNMETRIVKSVLAAVSDAEARNEEFGKSLAGALGTLGEGLVAQTQRVDQLEGQPARAPKSQQVLSKGFDGPTGGESLTKSQVAATLVDMVEQQKIDAPTVIRFESTGQIDDTTMAKVVAHRAGK